MLDRALHPAKCMLLPAYQVLLRHCTRMVPSANKVANKHTSPALMFAKDNSDRTTTRSFYTCFMCDTELPGFEHCLVHVPKSHQH